MTFKIFRVNRALVFILISFLFQTSILAQIKIQKKITTDGDGIYIYKYDIATSVGNKINLPDKFELHQNYPNPFGKSSSDGNSFTTIKYSVPKGGNANSASQTNVQLKIYDLLGCEVATLVNKKQPPGNYEAKFNASGLPSGIYFYRLQAGTYAETKKMILLR